MLAGWAVVANTTFMSKHEIGHGLIWSAVVQCESLVSAFTGSHWWEVGDEDDDGDRCSD